MRHAAAVLVAFVLTASVLEQPLGGAAAPNATRPVQTSQEALLAGPPFTQQAYLKAPTTEGPGAFGWAVAVSGDTAVVGAPFEQDGAGAVHVFVRANRAWSHQALLQASSVRPGDFFGNAVAIAGDTIVVGARSRGPMDDESDMGPAESGSAYVFVRTGTSWSLEARLTGADFPGGSNFGAAVAVSGDTVVVGASDERSASMLEPPPGAAYVFARTGTTWSRQARLQAVYGGPPDFFGEAVAVSGDTVIVGAPSGDTAGISTGAAYVYVRTGTTWRLEEQLHASNADDGDAFGAAVAIDGDTVVVGATFEGGATGVNGSASSNDTPEAGAAYAFVRVASRWTQQAYLKALKTGIGDEFGVSVAVSGDVVVVGAAFEDSGTGAVDVAGNVDFAASAGAAYVFARQEETWRHFAYLKASDAGAGDLFGLSVAVAGDLVVVGAPMKGCSATDQNGTPSTEAPIVGAAYVFGPPA